MTLPAVKTRELPTLRILSSRTVYPLASLFLAPGLPPRFRTTARTGTTTVQVHRMTTSILDSLNNHTYLLRYVLDPHDHPRLQASPTRRCTRMMMLISSTAGGSKRRCQGVTRVDRPFHPRFPHSPLRYPICPSLPCPPKIFIHLIQNPVDQTALPSTETIAQVHTCYHLCLTRPTNLASWLIHTPIPRPVRNSFPPRKHPSTLTFVRLVIQMSRI